MIFCNIINKEYYRRIMKKSFLLWMIAMLMLSVGMTGCSSDDDGIDFESLDDNHKNIIGEWQLVNYYSTWVLTTDVEPGEVTLTFNKNGVVRINNNDNKYAFFHPTGSYEYYFKEVMPDYAKEPRTILVIDSNFLISDYGFYYDNDLLILSDRAYDGFNYRLKKVE